MSKNFTKKGVLILIDTLESAGAENVAVNIAIRLKDSERFRPVVCSTRWGGVLEEVLGVNNIKYIMLKRNRSYEAYKFLSLRKIINEENIRMIHAHKLGSNLWGVMLGRLYNVPVIAHCHAQTYSWSSSLADKIIERLSYIIVSISEYERQRLIKEEGISPSKIVTIYNGIDSNNYKTKPNLDIKRQLGIKVDSPVVGIVAVFRPQKNHELFLLAAQEILKRNKNICFLLVGDGPTRKRIEDLALKLGIAKSCIFTGSRRDIPDILSIIDIGVLSSHWEGLPLAVLEYMASSKPIVATGVGGIPEVIQDGVNGFLIPAGDFKMLAQRVSLLLDNKDLALEMGRKGLLILRRGFTMDSMMRKIEDLYARILRLEESPN